MYGGSPRGCLFALELRAFLGFRLCFRSLLRGELRCRVFHKRIEFLSGGFTGLSCFLISGLRSSGLVGFDHAFQLLVRNLGSLVLPDVLAVLILAFQDRLRHDRSALRIQVKADSQSVIDFSHMRLICFSKILDYLRLIDRYRLPRLTHGNLFQSALLLQHIMCRLVQRLVRKFIRFLLPRLQ